MITLNTLLTIWLCLPVYSVGTMFACCLLYHTRTPRRGHSSPRPKYIKHDLVIRRHEESRAAGECYPILIGYLCTQGRDSSCLRMTRPSFLAVKVYPGYFTPVLFGDRTQLDTRPAFLYAAPMSMYDIEAPGAPGEMGRPVQITPREELEQRAVRLQRLMRDAGLDGVLATQNADIFYLSGVVQQAQLYLPVVGSPVLMVRKHLDRARSVSALPADRVVGVRSLRELPALIEEAGGRPGRIGLELDTLPVLSYQAYSKALLPLAAELVDASMVFRQARTVKSQYELSQIRQAARVADAGIQAAREHARVGMREIELAAIIEAATRIAGHSGTIRMRFFGQEMHMGHLLSGSSGSIASFMNSPTGGDGPGPWAPYGAGSRRLEQGEPVFIDYSGEWGGYIADQTRMLSIGPLSAFWQDAYAAMLDVETYMAQEARPGMTSGQFFSMAEARAGQLGYGDNFMGPPEAESACQRVPFVGHAVGLELDEWPPLQREHSGVLEEGMVLAVEPKLIFAGLGAIGVEDTYVLTPAGLDPLTYSTRDIIVV